MIAKNHIYNADCMEWLDLLEDNSCDMVLSDLPYGTTQCHWDIVIPMSDYVCLNGKALNYNEYLVSMLKKGRTIKEAKQWWKDNVKQGLWSHYDRVVKPNGAIVLFSAQPFTTDLIQSNRKMFRYEIIWEKTQKTGFYNAKKAPLRAHENILVFYKKPPTYNPIKSQVETDEKGRIRSRNGKYYEQIGRKRKNSDFKKTNGNFVGKVSEKAADEWEYVETGERYPTDVIHFSNWNGGGFHGIGKPTIHPTQKPTDLCEYLIKTFTDVGDTVLDNCAGSGSIPLAALNTGRNFYACEKDADICKMAKARLEVETAQQSLSISSSRASILMPNP